MSYGWVDYWTFGEQWFQYAGKTFRYSSDDDGLQKPSFVSYVTPANKEYVVCDFTNAITVRSTRSHGGVCDALTSASASAEIQALVFDSAADLPYPAFGRSETSISAPVPIDIDNDGKPDPIAELSYSSGGGRGCDFNYFELLTADGQSLSPEQSRRQRIADLQGIGLDGYWGRSCELVSNRLIRFEDRVYYEQSVNNADSYDHIVSTIENGKVKEVCAFTPMVTTTIKSIH